jgi:predicted membrane channel-forming protein YqfA (hemolysin III family)
MEASTTATTPVVPVTPAQDRPFWRRTWLVVGVLVLTLFVAFVVWRGASTIYYVLMAWFIALAMEPAVSTLATKMKRGVATGVVMLGVGLGLAIFVWIFGSLFHRPGQELHRGPARHRRQRPGVVQPGDRVERHLRHDPGPAGHHPG